MPFTPELTKCLSVNILVIHGVDDLAVLRCSSLKYSVFSRRRTAWTLDLLMPTWGARQVQHLLGRTPTWPTGSYEEKPQARTNLAHRGR